MVASEILHYRLLVKLGEGTTGIVYKAEDTKLRREVAIRLLGRATIASEEEHERFKARIQTVAHLNNPNIAAIHGLEETADQFVVVMEYVEGQTLREVIASGLLRQLSLPETLPYATQIAEALETAHERGVLHSAIRPSNIMITRKDQAKIMDLGLAMAGTERAQDSLSTQTVAYLSPEQIDGQVDRRTDIWSFGVVLYEMLTGRLPFEGDEVAVMIDSIRNREPESIRSFRADIPDELVRVLNKALAKDPYQRYLLVGQMLADLLAIRMKVSRHSD